jgi:hypothetical protein
MSYQAKLGPVVVITVSCYIPHSSFVSSRGTTVSVKDVQPKATPAVTGSPAVTRGMWIGE